MTTDFNPVLFLSNFNARNPNSWQILAAGMIIIGKNTIIGECFLARGNDIVSKIQITRNSLASSTQLTRLHPITHSFSVR